MAKNYQTGIIISGDGKGGLKVVNEFNDKLNKTSKTAKKTSASVKDITSKVASYTAALAASAAAGGAWIAYNANQIKQQEMLARAIGLSASSLSSLGYAARDTQISQEKLGDILKDTSEKIGEAYSQGTGEAIEALEILNLSASEMVQLSPDEQLFAIADALQDVGTQSEKIALTEKLASDFSLLLPLMENGADGLMKAKLEAQALGVSLSDVDSANIAQASSDMGRLGQAAIGAGNLITAQLAPAFGALSGAIVDTVVQQDLLRESTDDLGERSFSTLASIVENVRDASDAFEALAYKVGLVYAVLNTEVSFSTFDDIGNLFDEYNAKIDDLYKKNEAFKKGYRTNFQARIDAYKFESQYQQDLIDLGFKQNEVLSDSVVEVDKKTKQLNKEQKEWDGIADSILDVIEAEEKANETLENRKQAASNWMAEEAQWRKDVYDLGFDDVSVQRAEEAAQKEKEILAARTREYEQMVERIDGVFVDVWRDVIDGTDTAFDAIANMFKQLLAEMAHEAITKPIMLEIIGKDGSSGGLFGGDIGSIFSGGFDLSNIDFSQFFKGQTDIGSVLSYGSYGYNASGGDLISTAGAALGGYFGGPIGAAIGGEFGGLGLKTASRALFGGDWRLKTDDLRFDYDREDGLDASRYVYQKKSGGLLSSTKKKRRYYDMPEIETAYSDMVGSMLDVLDSNANQLGFDLADDFSTYFAASIKKKSDEEIQQVIADSIETIFSRAIDSMQGLTEFTDRFAQGEENTSDTLQRLLVQFDSISASTAMVNQAIGELDQNTVEVANNITILAGGLDALATSTNAYYQVFFSEQEQFFDLYDGLSESLNSVYLALPTTRDGFRDLVESLDLSTQAGQAQYTTLLNLSSAADSYYTQLESAQTEYYQRQIEIVETSLDALSDIKSALESTFESIVATVNPLSYMDAQTSLSGMLSGARAGSLPTLEALAPVLSVLSSNSANQYASYTDFERDQLVTANMVDELAGYTDNAISIEQQMLSELQLHTNQLSGLDDSIVNLTDVMTLMSSFEQRAIWQQQLLDINQQIDAIQPDLDYFSQRNTAAGLLAQQYYDKDVVTAEEEAAYAFMQPDAYAHIMQYNDSFNDWYQSGGVNNRYLENIDNFNAQQSWAASEVAKRQAELDSLYSNQSILNSMIDGLPGFASGGVHSGGIRLVGERGPELEITGPSRILNNTDSNGVFGDMSKMLAEMQAMRKEFTQLQEQNNRINMSIANSNTVVAKYAKRADVIGYKVEVSNP